MMWGPFFYSHEYRQAAGAIAQDVKSSAESCEIPALRDQQGCLSGYPSLNSVSVSAGKETTDEKQAQHFGQSQM